MLVAEAVSRRSSVEEIDGKAGDAESFESLYEVDGMARAGLNARLLFVTSRKDDEIWRGHQTTLMRAPP
jgi:hypothetical protein